MLRDQLMCDITNPAVQKRLLTKLKLTFTKAVTISQAVELAEQGSKEMQLTTKNLPKDIHKFSHVTSSKNFLQRHRDVVAKDRLRSLLPL